MSKLMSYPNLTTVNYFQPWGPMGLSEIPQSREVKISLESKQTLCDRIHWQSK